MTPARAIPGSTSVLKARHRNPVNVDVVPEPYLRTTLSIVAICTCFPAVAGEFRFVERSKRAGSARFGARHPRTYSSAASRAAGAQAHANLRTDLTVIRSNTSGDRYLERMLSGAIRDLNLPRSCLPRCEDPVFRGWAVTTVTSRNGRQAE